MIARMARPRWHVLSGIPAVGLALARDGPLPAAAAACGAVLVDADHLLDWAMNGSPDTHATRVFIPLHGWELPLALLASRRLLGLPRALRAPALALAAGWAGHLLLDSLVNGPVTPAAYLLVVRVRHRFRRVPSGWPPAAEEPRRRAASKRPAPRETLVAAVLALALLVVCE